MKPINVLEIIRQGETGGGESHLYDLVKGFDLVRINPIIVSFTDGNMITKMKELGIICHVIPSNKAFDFDVMRKIKQIATQEDISLIHAHGSRAASNCVLVAKQLHIPFIYTIHGWSFHEGQNKLVYTLRALSEKMICSQSDCVICVSQDNALTGKKVFSLQLQKTKVIENGVDTSLFDPNQCKPMREGLGLMPDDFAVAFIGRVTLQKDPLTFIEAIRIAHQQDERIKGILIGEGDMDEEVDTFIQNNSLEHIVKHLPFRHDIPQVLASIEVYSLCSLWEGLSIGLLEAMAMQKAIIATPTDGTRTVIENGKNGTIIPSKSPQELANKILHYLSHPTEAIRHGQNARHLIMERFCSHRVSEEVFTIYQKFIKRN